ncbi:LamG domain-containing protein [Candidatus Poribacteria bacterium]|nr:LamG domain-containing protein [Candidatus Poribacteria bacterium]
MFSRIVNLKIFSLIVISISGMGVVTPVSAQFAVEEGLISYWSFDKDTVKGDTVKDLWGNQDAESVGKIKFANGKIGQALKLEGGAGNYLLVTDDIKAAKIPTKEISTEAWVLTERFIEWGSFIGCMQDNGSFEKGWTLGMNNLISFAISTVKAKGVDGDGLLTYLKAGALDTGKWYHVVGTYDGKATKVYINGELKAETDIQNGDINYPANAFFTIGSYKDDNEDFTHEGLIDEVRLYEKVLTIDEVKQNFNSQGLAVHPAGKLSVIWGRIKASAIQ